LWKEHLGEIKAVIEIIAVLVTLLLNVYVASTNGLSEFWRGFVIGSLIIFIVAVVSQVILGFWNVSITEAQVIAITHLRKTETVASDERINIHVIRTEFDQKQNWWHVFGELLSGYYYTFEVVVDGRTGAIRKSMLESHANDVIAIRPSYP
jgi:hypothetical protein